METQNYGKRLHQSAGREFKQFWSSYRYWATFSSVFLSPIVWQVIRHGAHSVVNVGETLVSALVGLIISMGGTYLIAMRKGAETLDSNWHTQVGEKQDLLNAETARSNALAVEVGDLKRTRRTPFQEKEYQRIKGLMGDYDEDCMAVLRYLMRHGKMGKYQGGAIENLPDRLDCKRAEIALKKLLENQVVTQETITQGNMRRQEWTIAPGVNSALEELL